MRTVTAYAVDHQTDSKKEIASMDIGSLSPFETEFLNLMGAGHNTVRSAYKEQEIRQIRKKIKTTVSEDKNVKDVRRFFTECLAGADKDNTIEVWFS